MGGIPVEIPLKKKIKKKEIRKIKLKMLLEDKECTICKPEAAVNGYFRSLHGHTRNSP